MTYIPEYDKFVKSISSFSSEISLHSYEAWQNIDFKNTEPEIIRQFLLDRNVGVDYLNKNLSPILSHSTYEVKFASVYIHQKPRIKRHHTSIQLCSGNTESCELGDLMVVFCLLDKNKTPLFKSAVITQAKKKESLDSESQMCLYESDIKFSMPARVYEKSINPTPERSLPGFNQGRSKALNYLILNRLPFIRQVPWNSLITHDWSIYLSRILMGDLGLPFDVPEKNEEGWNCIIHDLLNVGKGVIKSSIPRGSELFNIVNLFNDFGEYNKYSIEIEDGAVGLPTMYVIVRDKEYVK